MSLEQATVHVIDVLNELEVPYVLVGAFAANYHGVARSTKDADFVAVVGRAEMNSIMEKLGESFRLDPQISFESATGTTRYILYFLGAPQGPIRIEFFRLSEDDFDRQRFARRRQISILSRQAYILTAEDVVVTKLRWHLALHRPKDREDARGVIAVQGDSLDWDYIHQWCDAHGTRELLEEVRASIPPI